MVSRFSHFESIILLLELDFDDSVLDDVMKQSTNVITREGGRCVGNM